MFFVYKIYFWHGRLGMVMAFIPNNISIMTRLKKQRWVLSAGLFRLADFPQKQQECFSEDHDRFISVDSFGREKSIYTTSNFFKFRCSY